MTGPKAKEPSETHSLPLKCPVSTSQPTMLPSAPSLMIVLPEACVSSCRSGRRNEANAAHQS